MAANYIKNRFMHYKDKWKCIKEYNGNSKTNPPSTLIHEGTSITSPKKMSNIMNNFFIEKIKIIRDNFPNFTVSPLQILEKLKTRNKNTLTIPFLDIKTLHNIIKKLKPSKSRGHDEINNFVIKKIYKEISPVLVHLYNSMIRTSTYPTIFKLSRITPLCKMNKNPLLPSSYRPINNLPCLEKIFEQYMLDCLLPFLNENEIIDINKH